MGFVWPPIGFQAKEFLKRLKLGSIFTGGFDGLAQVRQATYPDPGMLTE
jgi:hypothetical protein